MRIALAQVKIATTTTVAGRKSEGKCHTFCEQKLLEDLFDQYLACWGSADRMREYNVQMGLWDSKVQSTLTAAVVL
jgi:hypothetical protein